jgi:N-acetylneuraminate lyase
MENKKPEKLKGVVPALMTAFKDDAARSFDAENTKKLCKFLADTGVNGLYVGGSSGEMILMSVDERKALLEAAMEAVEGTNVAVIAHVGAMSTADTLELSRHAESVGADALSSVTPLYFKYSVREVTYYYERIAAETSVPVVIYNIPGLTGLSLNREQLGTLLSIPNVCGMKFTSSDFCQLERLIADFPDKVFYNGADEMLLSGLAAGADGGIGTTYNFMPEKFVKIYSDFKAGRIDEARKTQGEANEIICAILKHGGMPSSKYLINRRGFEYGICREPFMPLPEESKAALDKLCLV